MRATQEQMRTNGVDTEHVGKSGTLTVKKGVRNMVLAEEILCPEALCCF